MVNTVIDHVTMLLERMAEWAQCHCLVSLEKAIHLAVDQVMAFPKIDSTSSPSLSLRDPLGISHWSSHVMIPCDTLLTK